MKDRKELDDQGANFQQDMNPPKEWRKIQSRARALSRRNPVWKNDCKLEVISMSKHIPDVLQMMRIDHKRLNDYFFQFDQSYEPRHKMSFAETALNELTIHSRLEEEILYPFVVQKRSELKDMVQSNLEEHHYVEELMRELMTDEYSEAYAVRFFKLASLVKDHIDKEEAEFFPQLEGIDLTPIRIQIDERRNELLNLDFDHGRNFTPQSKLFMHETFERKAS